MKKFFSLVLALVMALSLTTVAWGAGVAEYNGTNYGTLQEAVDAAEATGGTITLLADCGENVVVEQAPDVAITIDGANKTYTGTITVDGKSEAYPTAALKIQNVNFDATSITKDACINMGGNNAIRYISNLTVTGCTFTGSGNTKVAIKSYTGGDKNLTIEGCIVNSGMHSLLQVKNVETGVKIIGCKVYSKEGVNLNSTPALEMSGCEFDVQGYAVRVGVNGTVNNTEKSFTITNSTLKSACADGDAVIVFRDDAKKADVTITGTTLTGTTTFTGNADETAITVDGVPTDAVAKVGNKYFKTLTEAMKAVTSGATLTLLKDVTVSANWDCRYNGAKFTVPVTIDGNGKTLKLTGEVKDNNWNTVFRFEDTATVKNLTIDASAATGIKRGISAKLSITVENCKLIGNGSGYGVIFGEGAGADIGNVTATITNSTFTNWAKGVSDNANAQDAKSVSITGSTFDNADVNVSAKETVTFTGNTVDDGSVIIHTYTTNSDLAVTATGNTLDTDEVNKIKAETITTDTNDFAITGTLTAPAGYQVLKTTTGTYVVVPTVTFGDKFDLYLADDGMKAALKAKTPAVAALSFDEVGAKKNTDGSGRVAYIAANNGQFFVKTTNPTVADYAVTYAGKTDVLYYVTVAGTDADNFCYDEEVKAFNNWGLKCGQINNTGWTTAQKAEDYFMASDYVVYRAAPAGIGTNYLLDGVVVSGVRVGTTIDHHFVASNFKYDAATGANVPTSAICTTCTQTTTAIYKIGKAPANAVVKPLYVDGVVSTVWEVVPAATSAGGAVSTPSTDKTINSADTFDAGIAMYVGMSVMAAAGSVVVLKKRED